MNEEEEKSFKFLKDLSQSGFNSRLLGKDEMKDIVNIIEKQQIEIKKLKDELREERNLNVEVLRTLKECVHKDRLKEIINIYKHRKDEMTQLFFSRYEKTQDSYTLAVFTEVIRVLEEIVGENEI